MSATKAAVSCFLVTILGMVSLDLAVEALIVLHEFLFLGFGVLCSSTTGGVYVHVVSSLRGHAMVWFGWFPMVRVVTVGVDPKGLIQGFPPVTVVLFGGLPFDVLVAGFFFPFFELPQIVGSWVVVGGPDDGLDECPLQVVLQDFYGAMVIQFDVSVFD